MPFSLVPKLAKNFLLSEIISFIHGPDDRYGFKPGKS
jgi:hypothetical protein